MTTRKVLHLVLTRVNYQKYCTRNLHALQYLTLRKSTVTVKIKNSISFSKHFSVVFYKIKYIYFKLSIF